MKNVIALDLGSSNTVIYQVGTGIVLFEPSVVALDREKRVVKEAGVEAKKLIGRSSDSTEVVTPVFESEVGDSQALALMLERFLNKITVKKLSARPKVVMNVPCGADVTTVRKFENVLRMCDVTDYDFVESLIPTAFGLGLSMTMAPNFIVDIGGGTTEIGAVSSDGILCGISVNMGGMSLDSMIQSYMEESFGLKIGRLTAERVKLTIASLLKGDNVSMVVNGSDGATGRPRAVSITSRNVFQPVKVFYDKVFEIVQMVMSKLSAEVAADIRRNGVYFSGGGSKMVGLEDYFREKLGMSANIYDTAEVAACQGAGILAMDKKLLDKYMIIRR